MESQLFERRNIPEEILGRLPQTQGETSFMSAVDCTSQTLPKVWKPPDHPPDSSVSVQKPWRVRLRNVIDIAVSPCSEMCNCEMFHENENDNETLNSIEISNEDTPENFRNTSSSGTNRNLGKHNFKEKSVKIVKACVRYGGASAIPILEDVGKGGIVDRIWALISFIVCIGSVGYLCYFLDMQTKSSPINDGVQGLPVYMGPVPAVVIDVDMMLYQTFVEEIETILELDSIHQSSCGSIGRNEKVALAYISGQIAASSKGVLAHKLLSIADKTLKRLLSANGTNSTKLEGNAIQKAVCIVKSGLRNCTEVVKDCRTELEDDCTELFSLQLNGKGLVCVFNPTPFVAVEMTMTLRSELSSTLSHFKQMLWKNVDVDRIAFSSEYIDSGVPLHRQFIGGKGHGISFTVIRPNEDEHKEGFQLSVASPSEPILHRYPSETLEYGREHAITVDVISEFCSDKIQNIKIGDGRNCVFSTENATKSYNGYSYSRCIEEYISEKRNCSFIGDPGIKIPAEVSNLSLDNGESSVVQFCHPNLWQNEDFRGNEVWQILSKKDNCPKSCNSLSYKNTVKASTKWRTGDARVHVYFERDEVEGRVKTLRRFVAEEIGIVLGMLGFCNDITLPKILHFIIKHFTSLFLWIIKKIMKRFTNINN